MDAREDLVQRVLDSIMHADLLWHDVTNTEMKDADSNSVRTIGTGFFATDDRPRTIILSLHKSGGVYGLSEKADRSSFGKLPGTPEQLRGLWDGVVGKVVTE